MITRGSYGWSSGTSSSATRPWRSTVRSVAAFLKLEGAGLGISLLVVTAEASRLVS